MIFDVKAGRCSGKGNPYRKYGNACAAVSFSYTRANKKLLSVHKSCAFRAEIMEVLSLQPGPAVGVPT